VNLFEIPDNFFSHPDYEYKKHISNIAASFNDNKHEEAALFHDIGKLCQKFQDYIRNPTEARKTTHSLEGALSYLKAKNLEVHPEIFTIFFSILKHHGNLENVNTLIEDVLSDSEFIKDRYPKIVTKLKEIDYIIGFNKEYDLEEICSIFEGEEDFVKNHHLNSLENYFKIKEVFSKLIFADKYEAVFKETYSSSEFKNMKMYQNNLFKFLKTKNNRLSSIRNQAREEIVNNFLKNQEKQIFIIEAPTGLGKTFSALELALKIVQTKNKKRIINALPMTSIIDQTYDDYAKIINEVELLKFHHLSYPKKYINEDDESEQYKQKNEYLATSWSMDKVIVTTFNQLLNLFYSNRNKELVKFWTIRNSVIIMDEIQAIPRILLQDFSQTINFLAKEFDIDFILMSATIPAIKNFIDPKNFAELLDTKYFSMGLNDKYYIKFDESINSVEKLNQQITKESRNCNSILCVVNTKKTALKLYESLLEEHDCFLLSANFIPKHRKEIVDIINKRLKNKQKTILIATQVIEAGVDLDFEIGFREFAPLSSIIQAAGRVNREGKRKKSKVIITNKIGGSPYHEKDIAFEDVSQLLKNEISAKDMLNFLKQYFELIIQKTSPDTFLIKKMKNLDFEDVAKVYSENYMQNLPYMVPIFIEADDGLYDQFVQKRKDILIAFISKSLSLEQKIEKKISLKNLNKELAQYIIHVPEFDVVNCFPKIWEGSDIYLCPFLHVGINKNYSKKTGWKSENDDNMW
jgi:CRISPR-associated endonuclease/helicase Cas3